MRVTVIDREAQRQLWGRGYQGIQQILATIDIADDCPVCGGPRGEPRIARHCEDGEWYSVSQWTNPCGHIDKYADVLNEHQTA